MNCSDVQTKLNTPYACSETLNNAECKRERKANLTGGLIESGLPVLGAGAIADAGPAQSISNAGTATAAAGTAASDMRGSGCVNDDSVPDKHAITFEKPVPAGRPSKSPKHGIPAAVAGCKCSGR